MPSDNTSIGHAQVLPPNHREDLPPTARAWLAKRRLPRIKYVRTVGVPAEATTELSGRSTIPARGDERAGIVGQSKPGGCRPCP